MIATARPDRRDHGRPGLGGLGDDDPGAARGRELERDQHPPHLDGARAALRGLDALREAAPPRADDARPAGRVAADGRALRRAAGPGHDRRRPRTRPRAAIPLRRARVEPCSAIVVEPATSARPTSSGSASTCRARTAGDCASTVPSDRHYDVTREVDLIEEVARVHGLDEHLPATLPGGGERDRRPDAPSGLLRRVEDLLRDAGLDEAIAWSFVDPPRGGRRGSRHDRAGPSFPNPLSEEQSVMRTDLIGGLVGAAAHNLARGAERVAIFESGRVYLPQSPPASGRARGPLRGDRPAPIAEPHRLAAVLIGELAGGGWRDGSRSADFYDAKGLVELSRRRSASRSSSPLRGARSCTRPGPRRPRSRACPPAGSASSIRLSPSDRCPLRGGIRDRPRAVPGGLRAR